MKKYLLVFLIIFIFPSVTLASWWNPFSWKIFQRKEVVSQVQLEFQEIPVEKIDDLQKQLNELKNKQLDSTSIKTNSVVREVKNTKVADGSNHIIKPIQINDFCLNIEGLQLTIPDGYSSVSGICTLLEVKDLCPNISGIQSEILEDRKFYKNTNECLTPKELNLVINLEKEANLKIKNCNEKKELVVRLKKDLILLQEDFQKQIHSIEENISYKLAGEVPLFTAEVNKKKVEAENKIYAEISLAQSEIQLYCD